MTEANKEWETGCCKRFDPKPWDQKEIVFKDKLFVRDRVKSIFHIPVNFGKVMKRNVDKIEKAGAESPNPIMLSDENSLWGADLYIAVEKNVPGAQMTRLTGTYLSKVYDGPFSKAGEWAKDMNGYVTSRGKTPKKTYFCYTTCPACAKAYGKNYVVLLAQV